MTEFVLLSELKSHPAIESPEVLRALNRASRKLAELKGIGNSIPRLEILINTLAMQEAKDSSEIENIVTTHDELFRDDLSPQGQISPAAREVYQYRQALRRGYDLIHEHNLLTLNHIVEIQSVVVGNDAGFRKLPGTTLQDSSGKVVYSPPQEPEKIRMLMGDLETLVNDPEYLPFDPLIKMAIIHHRFETIHPFYDGNGRTGRILNVLYLAKEGLLDLPILYLSRYILRTKPEYYRLLQEVRTEGNWEEWILYILAGVEAIAGETIETVSGIVATLADYKSRIGSEYKFYSYGLMDNLFAHPYTRIEFVMRDLKVSRPTATKYLDTLAEGGFLEKRRIGASNYYINTALTNILTKGS